jgi:hypothetical protein
MDLESGCEAATLVLPIAAATLATLPNQPRSSVDRAADYETACGENCDFVNRLKY